MARVQPLPPPADGAHRAAAMHVFVSRTFTAPVDAAAVRGLLSMLRPALLERGVDPQQAMLACDGRRLLWHLLAGELGSVETALAETCLDRSSLWPVRLREFQRGGSANVVVEHVLDGFPSRSDLADELQRLCLATHRVVPVRLAVSRNGRHALAFYQAPDAESVRLTQRHASVPPGHAWAFDVIT